nr:uncharacterized protein LOC111420314 [Onthophagus taurus]
MFSLVILVTILIYSAIIVDLAPIFDFDIWADENEVVLNKTGIVRNSKVLNFIPIPVEEECLSTDGRRKGVCMNTYECRIQGGKSHGFCAMGFGVCCVFTATCDQDVFNNITYFVNPHFPDLDIDMSLCLLKIKKIDQEISQIRLDFVHFNLGQPNRKTGICEDDVLLISGGSSNNLSICGYNSDQHVYFDVDNIDEPITMSMNLSKKVAKRFWEIRVTQIPFSQRAPLSCLQYHTGLTGTIQTMNFAENGRHLANQDYNICIRQEKRMCSIIYEPCDENSFRISSNNRQGSIAQMEVTQNNQLFGNQNQSINVNNDEIEGSGGDFDVGEARNMDLCVDKIIMPCGSDDFLMPGDVSKEFCSISRCGSSLCPKGEDPCKIETTVTPFSIGVHFGPSSRDNSSPDDNLGMCLVYKQIECVN